MPKSTADLVAEQLGYPPSPPDPRVQEILGVLRSLKDSRDRADASRRALATATATACRQALALGLSQQEVADAVGVTRQQVDLYRTGKTGNESRSKK